MPIRTAKANPSKAFFVRMLTRDISLDDCILDLVDNSVDGAWKTSGQHPTALTVDSSLQDYYIKIQISEEAFSISDNCGGIDLDDAAEYAFAFGRREEQPREDYAVGVYGIGMKRAVFKMGRDVGISSTFRENGNLASFSVPIEVDGWLEKGDDEWDFDIEARDPDPEPGVTILVRDLSDETRTRFADPTYVRTLGRTLSRDYMIPLMRGLRLSVNGRAIESWELELRESDSFAPMRDRSADGEVSVEIIAGMAAPPPDDRDPDERPSRIDETSGCYVFCNGRAVVVADRTSTTGWGDLLPQWHRQYGGFVGLIFFSARDPVQLPMTTTKRNVDVSSAVYRRALARMQVPSRAWIDYTNDRKQHVDAVKPLERNVATKDINEVALRATMRLPDIVKPQTRERIGNVNYAVPVKRLRALASALGDKNKSYRDVGLESFEYAYRDLVDDDEGEA